MLHRPRHAMIYLAVEPIPEGKTSCVILEDFTQYKILRALVIPYLTNAGRMIFET